LITTAVCASLAIAGVVGFWLKPADQSLKLPQAPTLTAKRFAIPFPNNQPQNDLAHVRLTLARDGSSMRRRRVDGGNATQIVPISGYWGNYAWGARRIHHLRATLEQRHHACAGRRWNAGVRLGA
jgi:hypothetical protein